MKKLLFYSSWRGTQKHYIYDMRIIVMKIILDFVTNSSETDYYDCGDDCGYDCDCDCDWDWDCDWDCDCDDCVDWGDCGYGWNCNECYE